MTRASAAHDFWEPEASTPRASALPNYYVMMLQYPTGREAFVDPDHTWADIVDNAHEAIGDGNDVVFIHHIQNGAVEDVTQKAFEALRTRLADNDEPLTRREFEFVENTFGCVAANAFGRAA